MKNKRKLYSAALASAVVILVLIILSSTASASTLNVGSKEKYKTIQSAVNAAKDGDSITVAYGTYKEHVQVDKNLIILGTKYPKVDGFNYNYGNGKGTINGFSIQKHGITAVEVGPDIIRNNYFYNCGITLANTASTNATIMNNKINGGTISIFQTNGQIIKGNTISNSKFGIYLDYWNEPSAVSNNTFKNCGTAVYIRGSESPGKLTTFTGNKYINNKINIGWGWEGL